jgi:hypothetical protein
MSTVIVTFICEILEYDSFCGVTNVLTFLQYLFTGVINVLLTSSRLTSLLIIPFGALLDIVLDRISHTKKILNTLRCDDIPRSGCIRLEEKCSGLYSHHEYLSWQWRTVTKSVLFTQSQNDI